MKYTLVEPIEIAGKRYTEFDFRERVRAGDLRGIKLQDLEDRDMGAVLKFAGRLCGQVDAVMDELGMADLAGVSAMALGFMSAGLTTGTTP